MTGTPAGIDLTAAVKGPVDSIQTNGSFVVLGQTISTNTLTQLGGVDRRVARADPRPGGIY